VILVHSPFWKGLVDWMRDTLRGAGHDQPGDGELFQVIDDPQKVVDAIFDHYHTRGFTPSPSEREAELAL
jgi:predicted Rossmann-fold nucleotide-binding protein